MKAWILMLAVSVLASGCSVFAPYDSDFQCHRNRDYGKCTDVQGAYSEALGGTVEQGAAQAEGEGRKKDKDRAPPPATREDDAVARAAFNRYKTAEYDEMGRMIEDPVTPVVEPPKVLRSLVVAYATPGRTLYMPRFVYFFVSDGGFVMGDYLNSDTTGSGGVVYPNGTLEGRP